MTNIPKRIIAALELVAPRPSDHLLEIGCGNGTASSLVCAQLEQGHLVAIDRSATQIALATQRLQPYLAAGKVTLHTMALETASLGNAQFDKIFAINVNCFWLSAAKPLAAVRQLLKADGRFYLCYQQPATTTERALAQTLRDTLAQSGFVIQQETTTGPIYCLVSSTQS